MASAPSRSRSAGRRLRRMDHLVELDVSGSSAIAGNLAALAQERHCLLGSAARRYGAGMLTPSSPGRTRALAGQDQKSRWVAAFVIPAFVAAGLALAPVPPARAQRVRTSPDTVFDSLVQRYFDGGLEFSPATSTWLGVHTYDHKLD